MSIVFLEHYKDKIHVVDVYVMYNVYIYIMYIYYIYIIILYIYIYIYIIILYLYTMEHSKASQLMITNLVKVIYVNTKVRCMQAKKYDKS